MKKGIISILILIILTKLSLTCFAEINPSVSKFTNFNEKISYVFLQGVERYSKQRRILRTVVFGATSLGWICGYAIAEDSEIKQLCLVESIGFLIATPIVYLLKSNNEKIILEIDSNQITPLEGLKKWKNSLLFERIGESIIYIGGGGYLAYKGIDWAKYSTYNKKSYEFMYFLGFAFMAEGIINLFIKYPDESFYDSLKENKLFSKKIKTNFYICENNYYSGINYKF